MKKYWIYLLMVLMWSLPCLAGDSSTYELVLKGKICHDGSGDAKNCEFKVGKGLHIIIIGVGHPDTETLIMESSYDGDFYAAYSSKNGCILVKRGRKGIKSDDFLGQGSMMDCACISPKSGEVYKDCKDCMEDK